MSAIAHELSYSRQNLTKIVDRLVKDGLVKRTPDASDRRVLNVELTEKGRKFMADRRERMRERLVQDLSQLSDEELDGLMDTFERVKGALPKLVPGRK